MKLKSVFIGLKENLEDSYTENLPLFNSVAAIFQ